MELLLGCGNSRTKRIKPSWRPLEWQNLVTLDIDPDCGADVICDFDVSPLPFADDVFDEVHAYEILEHLGSQGDYKAFFRHFGELHRVLKHGGVLCGTTPHWNGKWAWSDPGHRRIISPNALSFLDQDAYAAECGGETSRTDYRWLWKGNFHLVWSEDYDDSHCWMLQAVKPNGALAYPAESGIPAPKETD